MFRTFQTTGLLSAAAVSALPGTEDVVDDDAKLGKAFSFMVKEGEVDDENTEDEEDDDSTRGVVVVVVVEVVVVAETDEDD